MLHLMLSKSLYFLAVLPPPHLSEYIHQIKLYVSEKYSCKQALKSPPHITFQPPFPFPSKKEIFLKEKIIQLNQELSQYPPALFQLNDYDVFLPKVVFIQIAHHKTISLLYEHTQQFVKTQLHIVKDWPPHPFHPHITIAFRDIKKHQTPHILKEVQTLFPIHTAFSNNTMRLLQHNGKKWEVVL